MLNLKKTAVAVLAFSSSAVFAGTMGPVCTPGNVTVPCASTAWDFAAQALYLKPSYSGFPYVAEALTSTTGAYQKNANDWAWGFKLEGSYHFSTGNDLTLNWYHFDNSSTTTLGSATGVTYRVYGSDSVFTNVAASFNPQWDAVNLEFGQHAHFGEWKNIRFHGGVQYAYIETDLNLNGATGATTTAAFHEVMKYNGFGPRVGVDYWYNWGNGIAMYANGASALLVGTESFTSTNTTSTPATFTRTGSTTYVVPELEAKLGLTYTYAMAQGDLSLDVGWMWVNYFSAQHAGVDSLGGTKQSSFALQGPFIGLKWLGNVA